MDTSLIINATQAGKKVTKAISNINPEKDNTVLKTFAQKVNALTTNTYVGATRINKQSVEEASTPSGGSGKTEGVITYNDDTHVVTYNGDGELYKQSGESEPVTIASGSEHELGLDDMYFFATATNNYTAAVLIVE